MRFAVKLSWTIRCDSRGKTGDRALNGNRVCQDLPGLVLNTAGHLKLYSNGRLAPPPKPVTAYPAPERVAIAHRSNTEYQCCNKDNGKECTIFVDKKDNEATHTNC